MLMYRENARKQYTIFFYSDIDKIKINRYTLMTILNQIEVVSYIIQRNVTFCGREYSVITALGLPYALFSGPYADERQKTCRKCI